MEKATRVEELKKENQLLRNKIEEAQQQRLNSSTLKNEIEKFVKESENNILEMNKQVTEEGATQNEKLHQLTIQYEGILKNQIQLLTINKELSEKKENKDQDFNQIAEKLTAEYEGKIK
jgi:aspartate oxidase